MFRGVVTFVSHAQVTKSCWTWQVNTEDMGAKLSRDVCCIGHYMLHGILHNKVTVEISLLLYCFEMSSILSHICFHLKRV